VARSAAHLQPSKPFMESLGHEGLNKMLDGFEDRTAEAVCTFAFCRGPGAEPMLFQGRTQVSQLHWTLIANFELIVRRAQLFDREARPTSVSNNASCKQLHLLIQSLSGWDPIFEYEGKTYAEMDKEAKVTNRLLIHDSVEACTNNLSEPDFPPVQGSGQVPAVAGRGTTVRGALGI
jgi:Xanthosine triphosphate pyrophosphatase